jgi:Fe-S-cluster-containing hydrogenase component 2
VSNQQAVWIDVERCTGCGACVEACPPGAITLVDGKAQLDETLCRGCEVCIDACPEDAIQPVIEGEIVPAPERAPAVQRPSPLAETASTAVVATGVGLLVRAGAALARALGRWLTQRAASKRTSLRQRDATAGSSSTPSRRSGRGRRVRHRRRGR